MFVAQFEAAAGRAGYFEIKVRLAARATKDIVLVATDPTDPRLSEVLESLLAKWAPHVAEDQGQLLRDCLTLRNKLLHGDLHLAKQTVERMGGAVPSGGVVRVALEDGSRVPVSENTDRADLFGMFLEAGQSGLFLEIAHLLTTGIKVLDELHEAQVERDMASERAADPFDVVAKEQGRRIAQVLNLSVPNENLEDLTFDGIPVGPGVVDALCAQLESFLPGDPEANALLTKIRVVAAGRNAVSLRTSIARHMENMRTKLHERGFGPAHFAAAYSRLVTD